MTDTESSALPVELHALIDQPRADLRFTAVDKLADLLDSADARVAAAARATLRRLAEEDDSKAVSRAANAILGEASTPIKAAKGAKAANRRGPARSTRDESPPSVQSKSRTWLIAARPTLRRLLLIFGLALVIVVSFLDTEEGGVWGLSFPTGMTIILAGVFLVLAALPDPSSQVGWAARLISVFFIAPAANWHIEHGDHSHELEGVGLAIVLAATFGGFLVVWLLDIPSKGWRDPVLVVAATTGAVLGAFVLWPGPGLGVAGLFVWSWAVTLLFRAIVLVVRITGDK